MSLFSRFFGGQPQKSINSSIFSFLNPTAPSHYREGEYVRAYKGWTYACVNAIAEAFAEIELTLQEKKGAEWQNLDEHAALDLLHKVNNFQSFLDLTYATQAYLELDGNAFWYIPRNGTQAPAEIWYLDPTKVQVIKSEQDYIGGYVFMNEKGIKVPFQPDEIIHFKRFNPLSKYRGVGTVQAAAIAIDIDTYAAEWQRNFFGNAAMPAGILSSEGTLTQEQYDRIKANWDAKYRGVQNAHKMAILEGGLKYTSLTPTSREMQFSEGRKDIRDEILAIFRVPKPILGILEDVNLASAEVADTVFTKHTIKPKMRTFVSVLNEFYLPLFKLDSQKYRLNFKDPVAENVEQKRADRESGIKNYYLTPNEARAEIGLEPIEGGDELYIPMNMQPLSNATTVTQDGIQNDGGDNGETGKTAKGIVVKKNEIEGQKVPNELDREYVDEQIAAQSEEFQKLNEKLKKQLLKNLKKVKSADSYLERIARAVTKDESTDDIANILFDDYDSWIKIVYDATLEGMRQVIEKSGGAALAKLGVDMTFDLQHPRVLDWLNAHALEDTDSYTGNIKEDLILKVMEGVESGASNEDIAGTISQWFDDNSQYRALRIARTETINAYGAGALEGYRQSGVVQGKYWMPDAEACPICVANADAGVIGLDEEFPSGDTEPTSHPNCECSLGAVVKQD